MLKKIFPLLIALILLSACSRVETEYSQKGGRIMTDIEQKKSIPTVEAEKSLTIEIAHIGKLSGAGRIHHLCKSLAESLEDYEARVQVYLKEEIKFLRLCLKDGFGHSEHDSKEAWENHLKQFEDSLAERVEAMNQLVIETAAEIEAE